MAAGAKSRSAIVLAPGRERRFVKGLDLLAVARAEGGVLLRSMGVKDIDPEDRKSRPITDAAEFAVVCAGTSRKKAALIAFIVRGLQRFRRGFA